MISSFDDSMFNNGWPELYRIAALFALESAILAAMAVWASPRQADRYTTSAIVFSILLGAVYLFFARRLGYEEAKCRLTAGFSVSCIGLIALIGGVGFILSFFEPTCRESRISFGIMFVGHVGILALGAALLRRKPERGEIRDTTGS